MDLRRHLSEIEIVMIEAALEKTDGMVSQASDALKLRRTTLIEKMKEIWNFKIKKISEDFVCRLHASSDFLIRRTYSL